MKKKKGKQDIYFTGDTQDAIVRYMQDPTLSKIDKDKLYISKIRLPFDQMIRIMINEGKFYYTGMDTEMLVAEIELHLYEILSTSNFDPNEGRAFAYFNRCVKNRLIQIQKKNQTKIKKLGLESLDENFSYYKENIVDGDSIQGVNIKNFLNYFCDWLKENLYTFVDKNKEDEKLIAEIIYNVLSKDTYYITNKKLLFIIIKQQINCETYKINKVLNKIKKKYFELKQDYLKELIEIEDKHELIEELLND
jgi:hypothetical protein